MKLTNGNGTKDPGSDNSSARSPARTMLPAIEGDISLPHQGRIRLPPLPSMPTFVPPLPREWEGTELMRDWLRAKIEEDRRRQEEERTRQINMVSEQRRLEHAIISDLLRAGVPSHLVPEMFKDLRLTQTQYESQDVQRLWSGPENMIYQQSYIELASTQQSQSQQTKQSQQLSQQSSHRPQQPPQHPFQQSSRVPHSKSKLRSEKTKICLPGMDQSSSPPKANSPPHESETSSDILEAAFHNTLPLVASLEQAAQSHDRSQGTDRLNGTGSGRKQAVYHYYTPDGQWSSEPQHSIRHLRRSQVPAGSTALSTVEPHLRQKQKNSGTKRKDPRSHGGIHSPHHPSAQGPADKPRDSSKFTHKRRKSDFNTTYEFHAYNPDSSRQLSELTPVPDSLPGTLHDQREPEDSAGESEL
ncbi:uncharacterized protein N7529_005506 [Penicillium soppii]|uniref:uncharacterized protein n=1 Tax=Penicillium soppii TaxID=69789 RepID=UPI0025488639|nr:uncharacterized protein N7529_005506 [Penicillium soppii]KAJ5863590.1 hypothetical protein N7529_005506 [Penicillium soppii]